MPVYCPASQHWWWWALIPLEPYRPTPPSFRKVVVMFFITAIGSKGRHDVLVNGRPCERLTSTITLLEAPSRSSWTCVDPNYISHSQCSWALARLSWNDVCCQIWIRSSVNIWLGKDCISPSSVLSKWPIWTFAVFLPSLVSFQFHIWRRSLWMHMVSVGYSPILCRWVPDMRFIFDFKVLNNFTWGGLWFELRKQKTWNHLLN